MSEVQNGQRAWLISYLQDAQERGYPPPSDEMKPEVLGLMLQYIGDSDPLLRDELIYFALYQWIFKTECLDAECLLGLLKTSVDDNHLFYCIGNREDDTVFTRTFSALVVSLVLARHRKQPFLTAELFARTKDRLLKYYKEEQDLRGYVGESGWAHGAAHGADALDELALCLECTPASHREILDAVKCMIRNGSFLLCHQEDDRMTNIIHSIHTAGLISSDELEAWVRSLVSKDEPDYYARYVSMTNARNLIRSIYFWLRRDGCCGDFLDRLADLESQMHRA